MTRPSLPRRTVEDGDTNQPSRPLVPRLACAAGPWRPMRASAGYVRGTARLPARVEHAGVVDCIQKVSIQSSESLSFTRDVRARLLQRSEHIKDNEYRQN